MAFRHTVSVRGHVFKRVGRGALLGAMMFAGLGVVAIGVWVTVGGAGSGSVTGVFVQMIIAMCATIALVAVRGLAQKKPFEPAEIFFDAERAQIVIGGAPAGPVVEIPFAEIRGIEMRVKSSTTTSGGRSSTSSTSYRYVAGVATNAGTIEVFVSGSRSDVERVIDGLRGCVASDRGAAAADVALPEGLDVRTDGASTTLRWRNASGGALVFFFLVAATIAFVMTRFAALFTMDRANDTFFYGVLGFIALVFVFVVASNVQRFVRDLRSVYELTLDATGATYAERPHDAPDAPPRTVIAIASSEVTRVAFDFRIDEAPQAIAIVRDVGKDISVDVAALSATERVMLVRWIRAKLRA